MPPGKNDLYAIKTRHVAEELTYSLATCKFVLFRSVRLDNRYSRVHSVSKTGVISVLNESAKRLLYSLKKFAIATLQYSHTFFHLIRTDDNIRPLPFRECVHVLDEDIVGCECLKNFSQRTCYIRHA